MNSKQLFYAFIIGIMVCFLALKMCNDKPQQINIADVKKQFQTEKKEADIAYTQYQQHLKQFVFKADSLTKLTKDLSLKLSAAQSALKRQQLKTSSVLPCDTLKKEVQILNNLTDASDYLCVENIQVLNQSIAIRDTQILFCKRNYESLFEQQKENRIRAQRLTDELNVAYRQSKNKRMESKVLTYGLMIMTGITTTLLIKSKQ